MSKAKFVFPAGTAVYPSITQRDDFGEFATKKFKTEIEFSPEDLAKVQKQIKDWADDQKFKVKEPKMPWRILKDGRTVIKATSGYRPLVVDASKKEIPQGSPLRVGGGSTIRVVVEPYNYDKGVSLRLKKVQVIELVNNSGADEFDVEDGFEADDEVNQTSSRHDEPDDDLDL